MPGVVVIYLSTSGNTKAMADAIVEGASSRNVDAIAIGSSTFNYKAKAEAFTGRMLYILNDAALSFMISVGHRTGLYDKMSCLPSSTSQHIADAACLNERYVRECSSG